MGDLAGLDEKPGRRRRRSSICVGEVAALKVNLDEWGQPDLTGEARQNGGFEQSGMRFNADRALADFSGKGPAGAAGPGPGAAAGGGGAGQKKKQQMRHISTIRTERILERDNPLRKVSVIDRAAALNKQITSAAEVLKVLTGHHYHSHQQGALHDKDSRRELYKQFVLGDRLYAWDDVALGRMVGEGSVGEVYESQCRGQLAAVKMLRTTELTGDIDPTTMKPVEVDIVLSENDLQEFADEVILVSKIPKMENLVAYIGCGCRNIPMFTPETQPPPDLRSVEGAESKPEVIGWARSENNIHNHAPSKFQLFLVQEFMAGGSLQEYISFKSPNTRISVDNCLEWGIDIASAMEFLHQQDPPIVHRDLKPGNILLDKQRQKVKVCDFGLAKIQPQHLKADDEGKGKKKGARRQSSIFSTAAVPQAGTYRYMAPEVYAREEFDESSDVFSYAVLMYEIFCRQRTSYSDVCFPDGNEEFGITLSPLQVAHRVALDGMRPVIPGHWPPQLVRMITRCWDQDPELRPSFTEVLTMLRDMQKHQDEIFANFFPSGGCCAIM